MAGRQQRFRGHPGAPLLAAGSIERLPSFQTEATVEAARGLTLEVATGWWDASIAKLPNVRGWIMKWPPTRFTKPSDAVVAEARSLGRGLAELSPVDASAMIGRLYIRSLPSDLRAERGVFYTPSLLVNLLLDRAEQDGHSWLKGATIDPSCGGGAFLVEAALRISKAMEGADPAIVVHAIGKRLVGWELDPFAAWLAQLSVEVATLSLADRAGVRIPDLAHTRDSLHGFEDGAGRFDLVVGNPPFGKVKDTPSLRTAFGRSLFGHPNLYGMFTDLAVTLAKPKGGRVAYLTPASFLAGNYFKRLRALLASTCCPVSIDFVSSRRDIFEDVLQEVVLSTLRRGRQAALVTCHAITVTSEGLTATKTGTVAIPSGESPWILPRSALDAPIVEGLSKLRGNLGDWGYRVSTGPLVWNRHKPRLYDTPGEGRIPVVWAEAISGGRFDLGGPRRAHKLWFAPRLEDEAILVRTPCVLVQRTTSAEQERRIVCAPLPAALIEAHGSITVENHLNMVVPAVKTPKIPPAALARFLSSEVVDRVIRCINASVAVSASELEAMPLPEASDVMVAMESESPDAALGKLFGL